MNVERLRETRVIILKRRAMHAKAAKLSASLEGVSFQGLTIRCNESHKGGRRPKLAEAAIVEGHLLFTSKIDWMPSDELTLRPWHRESLEGYALDGVTLDAVMTDDDFLSAMIDQNDEWEAGVLPKGDRWLQKAPSFTVLTAVPLSEIGAPPAVGLWVRCRDHAAEPERCNPLRLVESTR